MAINAVAGGRAYHIRDILCEFLDHNFGFSLCTLKPINLKKTFQPWPIHILL